MLFESLVGGVRSVPNTHKKIGEYYHSILGALLVANHVRQAHSMVNALACMNLRLST